MSETPICKSSEKIRPEWVETFRHESHGSPINTMTASYLRAAVNLFGDAWNNARYEILAFRDGFGPDGPLPAERSTTCKAPEWCPRIWGEFREHCSPECAQLFCDNANAKLFDPVPAKPKCEDWCGLTYEDGRVPTDWHGPQTFPFGVTYGSDEQDAYCTQACLDAAKLEKSPSYDPIENRWCTNDDVHWAQCEYIGCAHLRSRTGGSAPGENTAPVPGCEHGIAPPRLCGHCYDDETAEINADAAWKAPSDASGVDFWGDTNMVQHSGVALLPDKFGTARSKLERENAQFRPRWR